MRRSRAGEERLEPGRRRLRAPLGDECQDDARDLSAQNDRRAERQQPGRAQGESVAGLRQPPRRFGPAAEPETGGFEVHRERRAARDDGAERDEERQSDQPAEGPAYCRRHGDALGPGGGPETRTRSALGATPNRTGVFPKGEPSTETSWRGRVRILMDSASNTCAFGKRVWRLVNKATYVSTISSRLASLVAKSASLPLLRPASGATVAFPE